MIVRDNADTIEACLESIKPWVDEMVVVDTGSRDSTPELVRRCGASLYRFPWCDDFSAARNESFKCARGEWIFWMDSDDTIDANNGRKLRELADGASDPSIMGYVMQVHCPAAGANGGTDVTVVDHVKLVRNRPDLRFEGRIHEQILSAIRRAGGEVAFTDLFVVHSGADLSPEGRRRKLERDFRLLQLDIEARPNHPFVLFNLGMTHADAGEHRHAIEALRASVRASHPTESHVRKAYALLVGSCSQLGLHDEAWQECQEGRRLYPDDAELLFREGVLHQRFGRLGDAERAYRRILEQPKQSCFLSIDHGIQGFKTRHNLALVYEDLNDLASAEEQWRKTVEQEPGFRPGWQGLANILLRQGKLEAAEEQAERLRSDASLADTLRVEALILQGWVAVRRGNELLARQLFEEAVARWPNDPSPRQALCRFLFEYARPAEAEPALLALLNCTPDDPAAYHNLGAVYLQAEQYEKAVEAFQESIRLRPDFAETHASLRRALELAGRQAEENSLAEATARERPGEPMALSASQGPDSTPCFNREAAGRTTDPSTKSASTKA